jgi:diguanylate cyclase (GGDEF)-like protein
LSESPTVADLDAESIDTAIFAWEWARELIGTSWVAADRTVIAEQLRELTRALIKVLEQEPFAPGGAIAIGQSLVDLGFASPDALARTSILISQRFLPDLGPAYANGSVQRQGLLRDRLAELLGKLSLGFVRAVRDRTLEEQDAIRSSAVLALERSRADQRESRLRDQPTGLLNRDGFIGALQSLIDRLPTGVVGVCLLSLGGFEALDRGLGRTVGDQILATVAERLVTRFDGGHELVARVGRDEFLVAAIDGADPAPVKPGHDTVANRLAAAQQAIRESITLNGRPVVLSTSFGVVARPAAQTKPEVILRDADLAASWARSRGPGAVAFFDAERAARQISDLGLTAEIPEALQSGRLRPHYQPIVSLQSGRIEAVEALARWSHEEHGLLPPDRFLHLATNAGLMSALGRTMLERACSQGTAWQQVIARPPVIAVNLAASQLIDSETVREVVTVLERTGLPPELLQLEITEHAALGEAGTLRVIRDLARVGVGLALDDFGTGQAHLAHLSALPGHGVRTLKLPADFLRRTGGVDVSADSVRGHVFATMINLAHDLGLQVTVEGVETPVQDTLVRSLGADLAQGSYYSAPEPAENVGWLLGSGRTVRAVRED